MGTADPPDAFSRQIFTCSLSTYKYLPAYQISTFYLNYFLRQKVGPKIKCGTTSTSPLLHPIHWNFCVYPKYLARSNCLPNFSIVALYIVKLCICHRLTIICTPKWVFWGTQGEDVKILCSNPREAIPCVRIRISWCVAYQNLFNGQSVRSIERFCIQRKK